ncbi:CHAT domain-containing protein [Bradyrhizobium diazoefficiens]|nr:CHAT domain-containing protein [Bradyrhizobium diazoefficiens]MBR0704563.1 CHAT domain-containing protein [Bradyrhizobium diazoefficiens]MBR0773131.1 CHAT domain-containing protein [Bradyrhizobium diazoefficiens]
MLDPLKIYYAVLLVTDAVEDTTPFQLYSTSWHSQHWALNALARLPADVLEPTLKLDDVIAHRMGGMRTLMWLPISINAFEQMGTGDMGIFLVCLTGDDRCAKRVADWIKKQPHPVLHVSTQKVDNACKADDLNLEVLQSYCAQAFAARPQAFSDDQRGAAEAALNKWTEPEDLPIDLIGHGHNVTIPNYMSLRRSRRSISPGERFIGSNEEDYTKIILESTEAALTVRHDVGIKPLHFMSLLRPAIILAEPALVRTGYAPRKPEGPLKDKTVAKTLRWIQTQRGLHSKMDGDFVTGLMKSTDAKSILAARSSELVTFTLGVGLHAAQTASCVIRLSPGVNHVFPNLRAYAQNIRSSRLEARLKTKRLFERIQTDLATAVGTERVAFIERHGGPLKIVSDAPIEWLPMGELPLGIKFNCSRLNATPGNLLMGALTEPVTVTLAPKQLQKILVLSAFEDADPLKNILIDSLEATRRGWEKNVEVVYRTAKSKAEFIAELNAFDGNIMVFDGHGAGNAEEPIARLVIAAEELDVWSLRGSVRVPPIVILSACDTHGADASSQATVGNGFLAIGARTVLGTLLPVDGRASAGFIARLVFRIAEFIPAVLSAKIRVLNWTEVVGGMLRMLLASEILDSLVGPPQESGSARAKLQTNVNVEINSGEHEDWFERLLAAISEVTGRTMEHVRIRARAVIARSEAIRYVQLGNPETILIDDGEIRKQVMAEYGAPPEDG